MEYLKEFLIGGSIIAGSKFVSQYFGPTFAPIIGGMPTGIIASYFLNNDKQRQKFFRGYSISSPILALSILTIYALTLTTKTISVNIISTLGLFIWAILSFIGMNYIS